MTTPPPTIPKRRRRWFRSTVWPLRRPLGLPLFERFNPNDWIGATVVLHRTTTLYAGETVAAFRLTECRKVAGQEPAAKAPQPIPVETIEDDDDSVPF